MRLSSEVTRCQKTEANTSISWISSMDLYHDTSRAYLTQLSWDMIKLTAIISRAIHALALSSPGPHLDRIWSLLGY